MVGYSGCIALRTCAFDFGSGAAARRTFADLLKIAEQGSLGASYFAGAITSCACFGCASGFATGSAAPRAYLASHYVGLAAGTEDGIAK